MKRTLLLLVASLTFLTTAPVLRAQGQDLPETKIVLRVSRDFVRRLVGTEFAHTEPIASNADGVNVDGTARVTARFDVRLIESTAEADFDLLVSGEVATQLTATRRPVVVHAHGTAPFSGRRKVVHEGDAFRAETLAIDVCNHFMLDEICPFRNGLVGGVTSRLARPFVRRGLTDGDRQANSEIRSKLSEGLGTELDRLLASLNKVQPLVKKTHQAVRAEFGLPPEPGQFYKKATKDHLFISYGKANERMAKLPHLDAKKHAPLELWLAVPKDGKDAKREKLHKFLRENWEVIAPILIAQLERRSPQLAKDLKEPLVDLMKDVRMHDLPGWRVICFAPKIQQHVIEIP